MNLKALLSATAIATCLSTSGAFAAAVTSLPGGTVIPMAETNTFSAGPIVQAPGITWSSANENSVFGYTNGYGFSDNGFWGGSPPMIGTNDGSSTMEYSFSSLLSGVGGFINYARIGSGYDGNAAVIAIYDSNHVLLESSLLSFVTSGQNTGEFHGFTQATANIAYFSLTGAYIGLRDLTITPNISAVPEPETYAMMIVGLGLLGFAARRRKQKAA